MSIFNVNIKSGDFRTIKNGLLKNVCAFGVVLLFIFSIFSPVAMANKPNLVKSPMSNRGLMNSSWPMYCHDVQHTGQSNYSTTSNHGGITWIFTQNKSGGIDSAPAIGKDGTIFVGGRTYYGPLFALFPNGTEKWEFHVGGGISDSPAIDENGTIYVGSDDYYLYAVNPNGTLKWKYLVGGIVYSSPAIGPDGTVYIGSVDTGKLYALYPNGTKKWEYATGDRVFYSPAIDKNYTIYITSNDRNLYTLYPNGTLKWSLSVGDVGSPSVGDDGTIYLGTLYDYLLAINPNGTERWRSPIGWGSGHTPSIGNDGTIYIGGDELYAINPDGTTKWAYDPGSGLDATSESQAISADGTVYYGVSAEAGRVDFIAVNPIGTEKWRQTIGNSWTYSSPAIACDGTVYIGSSSMGATAPYGQFYAFNGVNNEPPTIPTINGPISGKAKQNYNYTIVSTDPEGNNISYYVDWGDGTNTGWIGPYVSGYQLTVNHTWSKQGTYTIKAKAMDNYSAESDWGTLSVTMPLVYEPPHLRLFECPFNRFPQAFPILRQILGY
jgi:outer membrane protein assembly factor BamB